MVVIRVVATVPGGGVMPIRIEGVGDYHVQVPAGTAVGEAFDFELQLPAGAGAAAGWQNSRHGMPLAVAPHSQKNVCSPTCIFFLMSAVTLCSPPCPWKL